MNVFRISPCKYNKDLSGNGASMNGGRWNSKGIYMLYVSLTPSLAMLETVVHLSIIPKEDYCIAVIDIPVDNILEIKETDLPSNWNSYRAPDSLKSIGDQFILEKKYLALRIPSAVVALENNILLNPNHPDFIHVKLISSEKISIDKRLLSKQSK